MTIRGYQIIREIGQGGMATVYLALQESLYREVALKVVAPALAADKTFTDRFLKEARIIAHLDHPKIVTVYDFGSDQHDYYLSMEFLPGGALEQRIQEGLPLERAISIIKTIADALGYAHSKGFVHRDVKPLNVLFRRDGTPVLTDFGIAWIMDSSTQLTAPGFTIGSPQYMSPEQIKGKTVDARSDLYSLGIMFYKMLTGNLPYVAEDPFTMALLQTTAPIPTLPPELASFQPILEKLLAKDADARFRTAELFIQALKEIETKQLSCRNTEKTELVPEISGRKSVKRAYKPVTRAARSRTLKMALASGMVLFLSLTGTYLILNPPVLKNSFWHTEVGQEESSLTEKPLLEKEKGSEAGAMVEFGEYYEQLAKQSYQKGEFKDSLSQIEEGLQVASEHPGLLALRDEIQTRLIENYQLRAERYRQDEAFQESLAQIREGLQVQSEHAGLLSLREAVQAEVAQRQQQRAEAQRKQFEAESRQLEIARLLDQAEQQQQEGQLTQPEGSNAYATYQQVLELQPGNEEALKGLEEIAIQYQKWAEDQKQKGALLASLKIIQTGLQVMPGYPSLLSLKKEVQAKLQTPKTIISPQMTSETETNKIVNLLQQCEVHLQAYRLTTGRSGNALDCYQQVLNQDHGNSEALAGIDRITEKYAGWVMSAIRQGDRRKAEMYIERLRQVDAKHPRLRELEKELQVMLAKLRRKEREIISKELPKKAEQVRQQESERKFRQEKVTPIEVIQEQMKEIPQQKVEEEKKKFRPVGTF